jgi:branched-chain amino acid transport system ATP-binding protein
MAAVTLLQTTGLQRNFGGLRAVAGVDFELPEGETRALIGPNGAGKTTFVSLICGRVAPTAGTIRFEGTDITRMAPHRRVDLGIAYTFQITSIFENLSCFDNVALAAQHGARRANGTGLNELTLETLERVGLADRTEAKASTLAYGHKRLLEVGIGLALRPKLLILDEPTQGVSDGEIDNFCSLVRTIGESATVLLIEHNMSVVMRLADRITVMNRGQILSEGTPDEIRGDSLVREAYLGA